MKQSSLALLAWPCTACHSGKGSELDDAEALLGSYHRSADCAGHGCAHIYGLTMQNAAARAAIKGVALRGSGTSSWTDLPNDWGMSLCLHCSSSAPTTTTETDACGQITLLLILTNPFNNLLGGKRSCQTACMLPRFSPVIDKFEQLLELSMSNVVSRHHTCAPVSLCQSFSQFEVQA